MSIAPFKIVIEDNAVTDLKKRLQNTHFPPEEPNLPQPWSMGVPLRVGKEWGQKWQNFDFGKMQRELDGIPGFVADLPSMPHTHFFHVKSSSPKAKPLLLCHGWPQTSLEFLELIPILTDPSAEQPFHVVIPSMPGYLWSKPPQKNGVNVDLISRSWDSLMGMLGYDRYLVHGGDWGSFMARRIGQIAPKRVVGVHITLPMFPPPQPLSNPIAFLRLILSQFLPSGWIYSDLETSELAKLGTFMLTQMGYLEIQKSKPQTLGFSLADSPMGLLAWHLCIYHNWSEVAPGTDMPEIDPYIVLREITATWLTNTGSSSARMYWEGFGLQDGPPGEVYSILAQKIPVPIGVAWFLHEPAKSPREWAECLASVAHWGVYTKGGHFGGMEKPNDLAGDIQKFEKAVHRRWGAEKL